MENYEHELIVELAHYNEILRMIYKQLDDAKKDNTKSIYILRETNRDMWENASHSAEDFDGAVQLSQFYHPLANNTFAIESSSKKIQLLELLLQSAYFARIDFCSGHKERYEKVYIGRGTLFNDIEKRIIIYDWRSPIASLFYRFETGNAYYDAPGGRISGDIGLKRQYEIKNGVLEYFFDADVQIADEFLRKMLWGNTSSKMKTIVETIQKDQDIAIRDMTHDLLMVQGIAGSGKTSIALHRVAYLKYQGLSSKLKSSDIIILSPNTLFQQYISNVLPELGEDEVKSVVFDDLVTGSLPDKTAFQSRFLQMNGNMSLAVELSHLRHYIFEEIHEMRKNRMPKLLRQAREDTDHPYDWEEYARALSIEESTRLAQKVDGFIKLDSVALYKKLFNTDGLLLSLSEEIELPNNIDEILLYSQELLADSMLQNEDALAVTYLQLLIDTNNIYRHIRQVVVDEAQDYYSLHFEILKRLFPNARYTILSDINQTIEKQENMSLYERITEIMQLHSSCLMVMNKSFRCTKEILSFSMQFLEDHTLFESFNRSGDMPQIIEATDMDLLDEKIIEEAVYSKKQGYGSIGIICKEAQEAEALYSRLKDKINIHLVCSAENLNTTGVFIIPITMSKGLEFDSVLIYGVDITHYHSVDDKKLLYIASTRALHRLNLFYTGEKSSFIQGGIRI